MGAPTLYIMGPLRTGSGSLAVSLLLMSVLLALCALTVSRLWDPPDVLAALRRGGEREARSAAAPASLPVAADAQSPSAL